MFNKIKTFLEILWTGIYAKIGSAKSIAESTIIAYAEATGLRVFGSPLYYLRSERVVKINGKKITILGFDVPAMVKDGFYELVDCGGFGNLLGDVIVYDVTAEKYLDQNDFGFFMNHEIGHLIHGDAWSTWKSLLFGKTEPNEGLYIDQSEEIAADQYAKDKGFKCPDLLGYLKSLYSRCELPEDYIEKAISIVKEAHKERLAMLK
jgi:hypothetical protein